MDLFLQTRIFSSFSRVFKTVVIFAGLAGLARSGVTLNVSPSPAIFGAPVMLTATITPSTATGKVTFYDGAVVLGTATLSGGSATLNVPLNATGTRSLVARYLGDMNNSASVSSVFAETVNSVQSFGFTPTNISPPFLIQDFAVGDFNGDGKIDVVVVYGGFVGVFPGNGDGTFGNLIQTSYSGSGTFFVVVAGDFNGDGKLDIAIGTNYPLHTVILLGNGDGTFGPPTIYAPASGEMAVADFNLDGIPDILVLDLQNFAVLLGKGDGTFQASGPYSTGGGISVAVGDVNRDGKPDVVTIVPTPDGLGSMIAVFFGKGDGTFSAPSTTPLFTGLNVNNGSPFPLLLEDLNGDGKLDLVLAYNGLWVCLGNGDGTFGPFASYRAPAGQDYGFENGMAAVDVNGDHKTDIVTNVELPQLPRYRRRKRSAKLSWATGTGRFRWVEYSLRRLVTSSID